MKLIVPLTYRTLWSRYWARQVSSLFGCKYTKEESFLLPFPFSQTKEEGSTNHLEIRI